MMKNIQRNLLSFPKMHLSIFLLIGLIWKPAATAFVQRYPGTNQYYHRSFLDDQTNQCLSTQKRRRVFFQSNFQKVSTSTSLSSSASWQSHVSTHPDGPTALQKVLNELIGFDSSDMTKSKSPDIVFLFVGGAHTDQFEEMVQTASEFFGGGSHTKLISLIGGGVIGENVEIDEPQRPSLSLLAGNLPEGAEIDILTWNAAASIITKSTTTAGDSYVVFGDPWSSVETFIQELSATSSSSPSSSSSSSSSILASPAAPVIAGGISCPANLKATSSLAINSKPLPQGSAIAIQFSGTIGLQTLVAQGCRPVGQTYTITDGEANIIEKLDGKPALEVLKDLAASASPEDAELISNELLCGIGLKQDERTTDYLCRQLVGFVPAIQGIAIAGKIKIGDAFTFQVRDKASAEKDMQLMVQRAKTARLFYEDSPRSRGRPIAALQVSCVARGRGLFGIPNVDLNLIKGLADGGEENALPVAGFFANGEIGPVGIAGFSETEQTTETYIHGFTTVVAVLCDYTESKHTSKQKPVSTNVSNLEDDDVWG